MKKTSWLKLNLEFARKVTKRSGAMISRISKRVLEVLLKNKQIRKDYGASVMDDLFIEI